MRNVSITLPIDRWDPSRGGAERYLSRLVDALSLRGHAVTVVCLSNDAGTDGERGAPHLTVEQLDVPRWPRWRRELRFANASVRAHRRSGRDVLFAIRHALEADVYQPHGGSYIAARRGANAHLSRMRRLLKRTAATLRPTVHVLRWLDAEIFRRSPNALTIAISRKVERELRAVAGDGARIECVHHGIDTEEFHDRDRVDRAADLRARFGLLSDDRVAVFLAHRFAPKGLVCALRALAGATGWHLVVGGRDRRAPFERDAARLNVAGRVHFAGEVNDSRAVLAGADAFVLPTSYDACSLSVLEALACGTPVITTKQSGSGELVTQGEEGFVFEAPDPRAFAGALEAVASDVVEFRRRVRALRPSLSWARHVDRIEEVIVRAAGSD